MRPSPSPAAPDATDHDPATIARTPRLARGLVLAGVVLVVSGLAAAVLVGPVTGSDRGSPAHPDERGQTTPSDSVPATPVFVPELSQAPSLDPYVPLDGSRPLRVLVVGDSVAATLQASIVTAINELTARGIPTQVTRFWTVPGFGLTADHPGLLDWDGADLEDVRVPPPSAYESWQEDLLRWTVDDRPDIVLVLAGAWDAIPRHVDDRWVVPGSPEWRRWYMNLVDAANSEFGATGALVVWLRYPCIESARQSERLEAVNGIIEQAATLRPGRVTVLPFDDAVCPGGRYTPTYRLDGDRAESTMRMTDGVHFDLFGAVRHVAPWLTTQLEALVVPPR